MAKKVKRALVLGGGSIKGAFEAGAARVVFESGFEPDVIYGVSVGALNGAFLANEMGKPEKPSWQDAGQALLKFWRKEVTSFKVLGKERWKPKVIVKIACGGFKGFYDMDRLRDLIHEILDIKQIQNSPAPFYPGVVDLESGSFFYGNAKDDPEDFLDYVIASTREPILMELMQLDKKTLVDGGVRNISPLKSAIEEGADEIITVAAQPFEIGPQTGVNYQKLEKLAGRTVGIMTNEIVNNDLKMAEKINLACIDIGKKSERFKIKSGPLKGYRYIESTVIRPDKPLGVDITDFGTKDIEDMIKKGTQRAKEALKARDQFRQSIKFAP